MSIRPIHRKIYKTAMEEFGGKIAPAVRKHGLSKSYSEKGVFQKSQSWNELLEEKLPDELLATRHQELLNKREVVNVFDHESGEYKNIVLNQPETHAVKAGLEMAYKLKGRYASEGSPEETPRIDVKIISVINKIYGKRSD